MYTVQAIPKRAATAAVAGFHVDRDVQQHYIGDHAAAELDRRAVGELLGGRGDFEQADIGGLGHGNPPGNVRQMDKAP